MNIQQGARVIVFDPRLYVDDRKTPLSVTLQPATVLRRYLKRCPFSGQLDDVVDVRFDYDGRDSRGHFVSGIEARAGISET